jgi:hypothetical protein
MLRRIHQHFIGGHVRIEVAVSRRGALQVILDLLIGRVAQARPDGQGQVGRDAFEERVVFSGSVNLHVDTLHDHRLPGIDLDTHAPVALAAIFEVRFDLRLVVSKGLQGRLHLAIDAVEQAIERIVIDVGTLLVARET